MSWCCSKLNSPTITPSISNNVVSAMWTPRDYMPCAMKTWQHELRGTKWVGGCTASSPQTALTFLRGWAQTLCWNGIWTLWDRTPHIPMNFAERSWNSFVVWMRNIWTSETLHIHVKHNTPNNSHLSETLWRSRNTTLCVVKCLRHSLTSKNVHYTVHFASHKMRYRSHEQSWNSTPCSIYSFIFINLNICNALEHPELFTSLWTSWDKRQLFCNNTQHFLFCFVTM